MRPAAVRRSRASLSVPERLVLGLPSLAMGVVPLVAPHRAARALGVPVGPRIPTALRLVGARELVVALAFLQGRSPRWLWGFVAQDTLDLPVLGWLLVRSRGAERRRLRRTCLGYLAMAVVDLTTAVAQNLRRRPAR
jgi:hypothetical protein